MLHAKQLESLLENFTDSVLGKDAKKKPASKLENLGSQKAQVETSISELDRQINEIQGQKFQKQALNPVMKEFHILYDEAPMEQKRRMLRTIV